VVPPQLPVAPPPDPMHGVAEVANAFGINLGEMSKMQQDELRQSRLSQTELEREIHELRANSIQTQLDQFRTLLDDHQQQKQEAPKPQNAWADRLDGVLANFLEKALDRQLGNHNGNGTSAEPHDPISDTMLMMERVEEFKNRISPPQNTSVIEMAAQSDMARGEVLKALLEDERERMRMQQEIQMQSQRGQVWDKAINWLSDNVTGDNLRDMAPGRRTPQKTISKQTVACPECEGEFAILATQRGTVVCPHCQTTAEIQEKPGPSE